MLNGGCPEIPKEEALRLIQEIEGKMKARSVKWKDEVEEKKAREEMEWLERLVNEHPAFKDVPEELRKKMVEVPSEEVKGLANRRLRKKWARDGVVLHLYAGEEQGYTFARAFQHVGGDKSLVLEVDWKRGEKWNMLPGREMFPMLLRCALNGWFKAVIGGPNCRTRSVLRHRDIPGEKYVPRPVRAWSEGQEWGKKDLSNAEQEKVIHDDLMMLRMLLLFVVAEEVRKATKRQQKVLLALEQPTAPREEEVVSWWRTSTWKRLKRTYNLNETDLNQKDYGGAAWKPTTVGGTFEVEDPSDSEKPVGVKRRVIEGKTKEQIFKESQDLARWAPGLMRSIARSILVKAFDKTPKLRPLSWSEHLRANHTPFRRDCRVCQEAMAKSSPRRRAGHPRAGVLSLDLTGPFRPGKDLRGVEMKFMLVGAFTWIDPKDAGGGAEEVEVDPEAPVIEDEEEVQENAAGEEIELPEVEDDARREEEVKEEEREEPAIKVYRMVLPLPSKYADEVLRAVMQFYVRLRAEGYVVAQIHTDRGGEFDNERLKKWCEARSIFKSWTPGDDPQGNGRCERSVQEIKAKVRTMLLSAQVGAEWWPIAARHLNEVLQAQRRGDDVTWPPFLSEVLVRKRHWRSQELEPTQEVVKFLTPAWDSHKDLPGP